MDSANTLDLLTVSTANNELRVNELLDAASVGALYGRRAGTTTGLTWGYYGGRWGGTSIAHGTVTLTASSINYVVVLRSSGAVSTSTAATNWNNTADYARAYKVTTSGSVVSAYEDHRTGLYGSNAAPTTRRIESVSAAYGFVLADMEVVKLHPSADTTARVWTIPANSSVAYPVGAVLEMINQNAAGALTIAITTDTMRLAGAGTTGSRTLAANGAASARKLTATEWLISGTGLS